MGFIGPFELVIHGTDEMPEHMKQGPRKYSDEYDYKRAFTYFDSLNAASVSSEVHHNDNYNETSTEDSQNVDDVILTIADPSVLNQVEDALQRIHHGQNWLENADVLVNPYMPI